MVSQSLKEFDDKTLEDMIFQVTKAIGSEVKKAKRQGKQKRYKGGREQEIESRVKELAGLKWAMQWKSSMISYRIIT